MRQLRPSRIVETVVLVAGLVVAAAGPAAAHVDIDPGAQPKGATVTFAFRVPNEEDNAATVRLDVQFPTDHPIANVLVQVKPGWTFTTQSHRLTKPIKTDDGTFSSAVTEISWVSTGAQIPPGGFDLFPVFGGPLPTNTSELTFKALQTYSNGDVVRWIELPTKGAPTPDRPAPVMRLTKAASSSGG
ncbi:MAG TPA: YcnI family protein [Acidimicrobiia bacterium]|nr:YcnI family protein [Acidimicrobiia bacterium]